MRIIDIETHPVLAEGQGDVYSVQRGRLAADADKQQAASAALAAGRFEFYDAHLLGLMDHYEIEKAVILRTATAASNAALAGLVRKHPGRFAAFAAHDGEEPAGEPLAETAASLAALDAGLGMPEMVGVGELTLRRFSAELDAEQAAEAFAPTMEACRRQRRPIMFHTGKNGPPEMDLYRDPARFEPLAAAFPDVPLILAHMGGLDEGMFRNAVELAKQNANVYLSTSISRSEFIAAVVEELGPKRLLFASDWSPPLELLLAADGKNPHEEALKLIAGARLSDLDREKIMGGNAADLLGI